MGCSVAKPLPPFLPATRRTSSQPLSPPPVGPTAKTVPGERATHGAVDDGGLEVNKTREEDSGEEKKDKQKKAEARREQELGAQTQNELGALPPLVRGGVLDEHLLLLVGNVKGGQPADYIASLATGGAGTGEDHTGA